MKGMLGFKNLCIFCIIGVNEQEQKEEQAIFVDLKVTANFSACILSDDVADTIDYESMANLCIEIAQKGSYKLLETYAAAVIEKLLKEYPVTTVWIRVKKPGAIKMTDCALVELEETRKI